VAEGRLSDHLEHSVRSRRQLDLHGIVSTQLAAHQYSAHDASFADELAALVPSEDGSEQSRLKAIQLRTGIPEPRDLDDDLGTEAEPGTDRQSEQIDPAGGHILAEVTRAHGEPCRAQFIVQFGVDEVHLAEVGLSRVPRHARTMSDSSPLVGVALHAQTSDEVDSRLRRLAEGVSGAPGHRDDNRHRCVLLFRNR
jgi:hypothetical protein